MKHPERVGEVVPRKGRRTGATILFTLAALCASWGYRCVFNDRHTSGMPLAAALAGLRSGQLGERERDLALRIVKNEAVDLVQVIKANTGDLADAALEHIRNEATR